MPIKVENRHLYPKNWRDIAYQIRVIRAKNKCENCNLENGAIIKRNKNGHYREATDDEKKFFEIQRSKSPAVERETLKRFKFTRIVIEVAHLDHNPTNVVPNNLKALCQRCHLIHDKQYHWEIRRKNAHK